MYFAWASIQTVFCVFSNNLPVFTSSAAPAAQTHGMASWLPHWPTCHATCMCVLSRGDSTGFLIGFDSRFVFLFVFLPTVPNYHADR
jgi:hypothetical protein